MRLKSNIKVCLRKTKRNIINSGEKKNKDFARFWKLFVNWTFYLFLKTNQFMTIT